jgi:hypothetical protein
MGSETFAWIVEDKPHRRWNLRRVAQAVRHGWLAGPEHADRRSALRAALDGIPESELTARAELALVVVYLEMVMSNEREGGAGDE